MYKHNVSLDWDSARRRCDDYDKARWDQVNAYGGSHERMCHDKDFRDYGDYTMKLLTNIPITGK